MPHPQATNTALSHAAALYNTCPELHSFYYPFPNMTSDPTGILTGRASASLSPELILPL